MVKTGVETFEATDLLDNGHDHDYNDRQHTYKFFVVMQHLAELLAGDLRSIEDLVVGALTVEVLVDSERESRLSAGQRQHRGCTLTVQIA